MPAEHPVMLLHAEHQEVNLEQIGSVLQTSSESTLYAPLLQLIQDLHLTNH